MSLLRCMPLLSCLAALAALAACDAGDVEPLDDNFTLVESYSADLNAVSRGEALFMGTCAGFCHEHQVSETDASFLFDCVYEHGGSDQELFDVITNGVPGTRMVPYGDNFPEGDDDKWKVIAYIRSQQSCAASVTLEAGTTSESNENELEVTD